MKKINKGLIIIIISILLGISIMYIQYLEKEVESFLSLQEKLVNEENINEYISNISQSNPEYRAEKESWFRDLSNNDIEEYSLEVKKMRLVGFKKIKIILVQRYKYQGENYELEFPLIVKKEDGSWKDNDLSFKNMNTENFTIKYFKESKDYADMIKVICEVAQRNVENRYGSEIDEKTTIKIYENLEMLRQSVKLSFPWQFAGWYEYPESIKTSKYSNKQSYQRVLEHELMHKLTIKESNNNMPYWFTEGLAVYFSNFYNEINQVKSREQYLKVYGETPLDILGLESTNLERLTDNKLISQYYDSAGLIVKYMVDTYGAERVRRLVTLLGKFPYLAGTGSEVDQKSQKRFRLVLPKGLGIDINQLNRDWKEYISS